MKVYIIIDIGGYYFCQDDQSHWTFVRPEAYATKDRAREAILKEIIKGELRDNYYEPIILQNDELPDMASLESDDGWIYEQGPEYVGYRIREVEVIE